MESEVLASLITGSTAIVGSVVGAVIQHWLSNRSAPPAAVQGASAPSPVPVPERIPERPSGTAPAPARASSRPRPRLGPAILLGLAAAGVVLVFSAALVTQDERWDSIADQFVVGTAFGGLLTLVAWTLIGWLTHCRAKAVVVSMTASIAVIALWILVFGTYTDVVISAVIAGGNGAGFLAAVISALVSKRAS